MPLPESSGGIGAALREAREQRGLSLRQIAGTTKIAVRVLEGLERNDISRLPGGIFGRAFVRAYAQEVGLDAERIIREFIAQFPTDTVTAGHPAVRPVEDREAADSAERTAWTMGAILLLSVAVAVIWMVISAVDRTRDRNDASSPRARSVEGAPLAARPLTVLVGPLGVASLAETSGPVLLSIVAKGPCWVSVEVDGHTVLRRELRAGDRESFEVEHSFAIKAGDAGVLALALDGREVRALGGLGEVVSFSASRDNFDDVLAAP